MQNKGGMDRQGIERKAMDNEMKAGKGYKNGE